MALTGLNFCKLCSQQFNTEEELMNHCFTVEHRKQIFEDTSSQWKHRNPAQSYKDLKLCERYLLLMKFDLFAWIKVRLKVIFRHRSQTCEYGDNCMKAHSKEELREWKKRIKAARKRAQDAADQGLLSYQDHLIEEYRHSKDKEKIVSDQWGLSKYRVMCL